MKSDVKNKVSSDVKSVLEKMSSIGNVKIVVENFADGDSARGFYKDGEIHLNANELTGERAVVVAVHESVHHVKVNNAEGYNVLKKYVRRYLELEGENVHALLKEIKENREAHGETLTPEEIMEELVADTISSIASDRKAMQAFLKLDAKERVTLRSVLRSIAERVKAYAGKLTGAESRILLKDSDNLLTLAKEMNKALKDAGENVGTQKNTVDNGVRYSLVGKDINGIEVYETSESTRKLTYTEKLEIFRDNFYDENSPHYLGDKIKFQVNGKVRIAEINKITRKENTGKINPGYLNQWDRAKINIGADGDFVTLLQDALYDKVKENHDRTKNEAHKRAECFEYYLKTVWIDGKKFDVVINVGLEKSGNRFVYEVKLKKIKDSQPGPLMTLKKEPRRPKVDKSTRLSESFDDSLSHSSNSVNKKSYSYGDESVDLWGVLDPMDDAEAETSELLRGYMETAGEILTKTRGVELKEGEIQRIANNILRKYTGHYQTEYVQRIELILDVAAKNPVYPIEDVVGEIAAVMKEALSKGDFVVDAHAEERQEIYDALRKSEKTYLTRDQLETLESRGLSLNWFKQRMTGKITIVKSTPQNEVNVSSFEVVYRDLAAQFPEWFRSDIDSSEMPEETLRALDKLKPHVLSSESFFEQGDDETSIRLSAEVLSGVIDAKYKVNKSADIKTRRNRFQGYGVSV